MPATGHDLLMLQITDTQTDSILRVFTANIQHDIQAVLPYEQAARETPDHLLSGTVGAFGSNLALGFGYERMLERVSFGFDTFFVIGSNFAFTGSGSFKFFPAPIFFMGLDIGLGYRAGFNASFVPQLGFRIGGRGGGFFTDIFAAYPLQIGSSGFNHDFRPGVAVGGSWW